jgi:hypothetical protein
LVIYLLIKSRQKYRKICVPDPQKPWDQTYCELALKALLMTQVQLSLTLVKLFYYFIQGCLGNNFYKIFFTIE